MDNVTTILRHSIRLRLRSNVKYEVLPHHLERDITSTLEDFLDTLLNNYLDAKLEEDESRAGI